MPGGNNELDGCVWDAEPEGCDHVSWFAQRKLEYYFLRDTHNLCIPVGGFARCGGLVPFLFYPLNQDRPVFLDDEIREVKQFVEEEVRYWRRQIANARHEKNVAAALLLNVDPGWDREGQEVTDER